MTADERRLELAAIFAVGIVRLSARAALATDDRDPNGLPESELSCLEVPPKIVLSVLTS